MIRPADAQRLSGAGAKWNTAVTAASLVDGAASDLGRQHIVVQQEAPPKRFSDRRKLNTTACGIRFAVAGSPVPMTADTIVALAEKGRLCSECVRAALEELGVEAHAERIDAAHEGGRS